MLLLNAPKIVIQDQKKMQCWAAATESWLAANPLRRHYSQEQIVAGLREEGVVRADGALFKGPGQQLWERYFGLRPHRVSCGEFSIETTFNRLKRRLPLLLGLEAGGEVGHVVVVFGAEPHAADGAEPFIVVMDPWSRNNYRRWKLAEIHGKTGHMTTWLPDRLPLFL